LFVCVILITLVSLLFCHAFFSSLEVNQVRYEVSLVKSHQVGVMNVEKTERGKHERYGCVVTVMTTDKNVKLLAQADSLQLTQLNHI
jgi:hypothetical protein